MNNSWFTYIDKLMYWHAGKWMEINNRTSQFVLRIHYDQLFISTDAQILETLNLRDKLKGIYKDDILILILSNNRQEVRKMRFRIKTNAAHCFEKLNEYFPVINHIPSQSTKFVPSSYRKIEEVFKSIFEENKNDILSDQKVSLNLPSSYKDFIKMCLLDPHFPQIVEQTEKLLREEILK